MLSGPWALPPGYVVKGSADFFCRKNTCVLNLRCQNFMCFYVVLENLNGKVCKNHEKTDKTQLKIQHVLQYHGIGEMLGKQNVCIFYG